MKYDTRKNNGKYIRTYLEEIMNSRMFKFFQGHVITHSNVLISHSLLKPSQARSSFSRRFIGAFLGGWDEVVAVGLGGVAPTGMDESKSSFWMDFY